MSAVKDKKVSDAVTDSWVHRILPGSLWSYAQLARWERPIGWWLLMWPCWWSVALGLYVAISANNTAATPPIPNDHIFIWFITAIVLFMIGAISMRGAGCTYNDLVDQNIDDKITRTRSRPLPSGRVTRKKAKLFLALQLLIGFIVLVQFDNLVIALGFLSLITVLVYPFMKRITWWPQLFLGFAFSWGAWMGWYAMAGIAPAWPAANHWITPLALYAGCICWVIGYDTIYAHQDIEDDMLVGVKSTARLFGSNTKSALCALYGLALALWAVCLWTVQMNWIGFAGLIVVAGHMIWQITKIGRASCRERV